MGYLYGGMKVEGARNLRRSLKQAGEDLSDLKAAHRKAADIAADAARGIVPSRTDRLRKSIRAAATQSAAIMRAGSKRLPYANAVHWGRKAWPNVSHPRATPSFMYPRLFLTKGAKETEPQWVGLYMQAVEDALEKIEGD